MNISIKEPCTEDWSKMTPNEKGAFCLVCTKDVIDFTKKSLEEIKDYFSKPKEGKTCGQFKNEQLLELGFDSFFERFSGLKMSRKVALVIAMSFMPWFFGSSDLSAQNNGQKKGKISVNQNSGNVSQKDSIKAINQNNNNTKTAGTVSTQKDPTNTNPKIQPKGEVIAEPTQTCKDPKTTKKPKTKAKAKTTAIKTKKEKEPAPHLLGDVDINYDETKKDEKKN